MQETQVWFLVQENPLEKEIATHFHDIFQYPCLGNPTDRRAWEATVNGVMMSRTPMSD